MATRANPAFAIGAVGIPVVTVWLATSLGTVLHHTLVHVLAGVLWTGIDLFMALVLGPVLGGLSLEARADVFRRFTPKMAFLMPTLAGVTIFGGISLALRLDLFPHAGPWLALFTAASLLPATLLLGWQLGALRDRRWQTLFGVVLLASVLGLGRTLPSFAPTTTAIALALAIVTVLTVIGFGVLLPGEVRVYLETVAQDPNPAVISRYGMRNAKLSGVQGAFQLLVVAVMVAIRWGWT